MRPTKLTVDETDRKDQRARTQALIEANEGQEKLPTSAPRHISGEARYLWSQLVPMLNETGYVTIQDKSIVEALVINYQIMRESYDLIKKYGSTYESTTGAGAIVLKKNPAVENLNNATAKIKSLAGDLGLSPASRAMLISLSPENDNGETDLASYFGGGE